MRPCGYGNDSILLRFLPAGPNALLVEVEDQDAALALHAEIGRRRAGGWCPSLVDVVPGARTVLLDGVGNPSGVAADVASWDVPPAVAADGAVVEIPCVYDGPDLDDAARAWDVTTREVGEIHAAVAHRVAFCGFVPGFAYLEGIGEARAMARRPTPRTAVPAGSVGLAGPYTGVYPRRSPGGWNLIGRTDMTLWDPGRQPPALLVPGGLVRFVGVGP